MGTMIVRYKRQGKWVEADRPTEHKIKSPILLTYQDCMKKRLESIKARTLRGRQLAFKIASYECKKVHDLETTRGQFEYKGYADTKNELKKLEGIGL